MKVQTPAVGAFCISTQGHDKGRAYVVVKVLDPEFVSVADGAARTAANPKKKRVKHLKTVKPCGDEVLIGQILNGTVKDNEIHKTLLRLEKES